MRTIYTKLLVTILLLMSGHLAWAQGTTTAAMNGVVQDQSGSPLPGATVIAVHTPTNTQYVAATNAEGRYNIQNMRVGGPYTVRTSYVGYQEQRFENINLALGQNFRLDLTISESTTTLGEVQITATQDKVINSDRTGASTNVSTEQLESLPTISRSLNDFTRITPQASTSGSGISFAGQNNRFNNFSIDGTVNNDVFGLSASGTNGGQTGVQPISLDAIEAIQVVIAPFDVRQSGFTGGGINAITRSGSNRFTGSAYYFGNNEALVGKSPDDARTRLPDFTDYQMGLRLGGPIIRDKLFFFVNGEKTKRVAPLLFEPGSPGSNITVDEANRVLSVANRLGYDPGSFRGIDDETLSDKIFARLDWNITDNHQLTLRHSYVYGENRDNSRTPNALRFANNAEFFPSTTNSTVMQLRSQFGGQFANEALIGFTAVRDDRDIIGDPFPNVLIRLSGGRTISLGSEPFSVQNQLDQDVLTITNNFNAFLGKHTITLGTHNEFYKTYNLFIRQEFGAYEYNSLEAFEAIGTPNEAAPGAFFRNYSRTDNRQQGAEFSAFQLGFYAQDEYAVRNNLKVTAGIRLDIPTFNDDPAANAEFNEAFASRGLATDKTPGAQFMLSPRVGVNWDVFDDGNTQVRGGAGVFTGRAPFVWIANQYTNTGQMLGSLALTSGPLLEQIRFNPNPNTQPTATTVGLSDRTAEINITDPDFKFPQLFRVNAAVDHRLPFDLIATLEGIYSKNLNNIYYQNLNLEQTGTLTGADNRPVFGRIQGNNFQDIIYLTNTSRGFGYSLTGQLQKTFMENGISGSLAYTYSRAKDVNPGNSSQARSNWINVNQVEGLNNVREAFADNDVRSRVVAGLTYNFNYLGFAGTTISAFYNGQTGVPLSYIYNGDVNNDAGRTNDLIYVPGNASEINLVPFTDRDGTVVSPEQQWQALDAFISGNDYLSDRRGQYAERNGDRLPWTNQIDLRIMQEFRVGQNDNAHRLQLTFDIFNFTNLLNKDWGRQYTATFNAFQAIDFVGYEPGTTTPRFNYTGRGLTDGNPYFVNDFSSRWRAQFGIRYIFN
ncbi:TonB-dependent receptor [Pontibacter lucknowensis]|uniref:Carboxypeptidase regulatory-like domain-containing protein n=1 Tax=Pontibacter lucknowensis TaxID=1077936 RepID=A0A1N6ZZQ8_9BACT|nr:TonB-dependent receptor [Pontibacter lucknowensis]SIR32360.1 Carboxypeptidase regulatory-like domain-containing protein [Pontibacter lucknowensis]